MEREIACNSEREALVSVRMTYSPRFVAAGALALLVAGHSAALADVKVPAIFADHMVLQQDMPVPVWGTADAGEKVKVTVAGPKGEPGKSATATTGTDCKWSVKLPRLAATAPGTTTTMTVEGKNKLILQDVLIGEVWVCSGQSNMEFGAGGEYNAVTELPKANDVGMRFFFVSKNAAHSPAAEAAGVWKVCTPQQTGNFSGVGYYFGKELRQKLNRPVGLIGTYWGGTPAEAWTSLEGLGKDPALVHFVDRWKQLDAGYEKAVADYPGLKSAYDAALKDWNDKYGAAYAAAEAQWRAEAEKAFQAKASPVPRPSPPVPKPSEIQQPSGGPNAPATLYNGMLKPLEPYAIRGAIWYQGEANVGRADEYRTLFARMIKDWRETWGEGDFPFLWVQLAGFNPGDTVAWPGLREAQTQTLSLPKTGMATAVDIGLPDNIHPKDKEDVGKRLALAARHVAYGEDLVYAGPMFQEVTKDGKDGTGLRVKFQDIGGGLEIGKSPWVGPHAVALPTDRLMGFELKAADGSWKAAEAKIEGKTVVVQSADVPAPTEVRYDWNSYPQGNLYNKEGLPAVPFHGKAE